MKELLELMLNNYCLQWTSAGVLFKPIIKDYIDKEFRILEIWIAYNNMTPILLMKAQHPLMTPTTVLYQSAILAIGESGLSNIYSTTITLIRTGKVTYLGSEEHHRYPLTPQEAWQNKKAGS